MTPNRLLLIAAVLVSSTACSSAAPETVETETVVPVTTAPATLGTIRAVIHATGLVAPLPGADLLVVAPEHARIAEIPRAEGDQVGRGDLLVRFEIPTLAAETGRQRAEVGRAQARIQNARAAQVRAHDLFDRGVAARKEMEDADREIADADADLGAAQAGFAAAEQVATRATVRATFDGIVARRMHNPGDLVEATTADAVLRIIDPRRLQVTASVPIGDVSRLVIGASAQLSGAPEGSTTELKVASRPVAVDAGTASVPIRLAFVTPTILAVGTPVEVDIDAEQHIGVVLVPTGAVVREGAETAVFVVVGNKAERRPVTLGLSDTGHVEVLSGIKAGDPVIVSGQAGLPDGATISIGSAAKVETPEK